MPHPVDRIRPWTDHLLTSQRFRRHFRQLLGHCAAGDGHALTAQNTMVEQHSQHLSQATDAMKVYRHITARWLQVAQNRHLPPHHLKVVQYPFNASCFRDRKNMKHCVGKHCVGRALSRYHCRNRIPDGLSRDDVARLAASDRCPARSALRRAPSSASSSSLASSSEPSFAWLAEMRPLKRGPRFIPFSMSKRSPTERPGAGPRCARNGSVLRLWCRKPGPRSRC